MRKITVLGNFSGRNAGDAAILGCLLQDISAEYKRVKFYIPTINTNFIKKSFALYDIKAVGLMPWNLSIKIFGLPLLLTVLKSDLILITDAILFDRKLYNPLFNYLWTISKIVSVAQKREIPVVLYNSTIGPIRSKTGRKCLKKIIDSADLLILRDKESIELLEKLELKHEYIFEGADCALNASPVGNVRFNQICKQEHIFLSDKPTIGFNVNSYVDAFVREKGATYGRENLVKLYANTADKVIDEMDVNVIFIETQHMDMAIAGQVLNQIRNRERVKIISNRKYNYQEICAVMKKLQLFVGMRTHSLILSSAMGIVPVGIVTYPKNRGYMRTIGLEKNLIEFQDLSVEKFFDLIKSCYNNREKIRNKMIPKILNEKAKAREAASKFRPLLKSIET